MTTRDEHERDWLLLDETPVRPMTTKQSRLIAQLDTDALILNLSALDLEWPVNPTNALDRRSETTTLYFVASGVFTKAGITKDIDRRMLAFRAANPHPMRVVRKREIPALYDRDVERRVHIVLQHYAVGREWFRICPRLASRIATPIIDSAWRAAAVFGRPPSDGARQSILLG